METNSSHKTVIVGIVIIVAIISALGGYKYGQQADVEAAKKTSYDEGYAKAEADITRAQTEAARKAAEDAAKAANPFEVGNPLENVESNPFDKVKEVLNPFE